jgi:lysophospholipase L1-like esterase
MCAVSQPRWRGFLIIAAVLALLLVGAASADAAAPPKPKAPRKVYLALGDSLAFGYQKAKVIANLPNPSPTLFNTGYVNVFQFGSAMTSSAGFNADYPGVQSVNLGCPGETSSTLLVATNSTTGCTTYPFSIHVDHPGQTQIQKAVAVLDGNGGKVVPVTIDIGANDVLGLVDGCTTSGVISLTCVQAGAGATFGTVQRNLDSALRQIRAAAGYTQIMVVGIYNPLYPAIFYQTLGQTGDPAAAAEAGAETDALVAELNTLEANAAAKYRAYFVDPLPLFNPQEGGPQNEIDTVCTLTAVCGPLSDIHPTDLGYAELGDLVLTESGY